MHRARSLPTVIAAVIGVIAVVGLAGCGGSSPPPDELLATAKERLDAAETIHFRVTGERLPSEGIVMVSGQGSVRRPASFSGSFRVATSGVAATLAVVSIDGILYAQIPFTDDYAETTAEELGIVDPANALRPERGISTLLTKAKDVKGDGRAREGEEVVDRVTAQLSAKAVGEFLYLSDTSGTVRTTFSVEADSGELRTARFTGDFYPNGRESTYIITLDRYGEPVEIERPK